ncbi:redox-regulated ATPase YchF [Thermus aquaticus]|uniref:Ribosome-binding ATPase YchF n=1 Tax=Thermus aquaticus (strain ATCC BAA-2747 / Y51MC23) TaxID=498848 RepID=A0ABN4II33_THEA5|nr:redox-regulated ATPase YchF [Thermus aquaticus]ALJ91155.1 GTP-binding and nucleic acid-binding protein YchF [Thermus aquaticus Y51MC23]
MLAVGIVGLPNVGKSTLFNALTRAGALAANYPFATIDKNVGVVALEDPRLYALQKTFARGERLPPVIPTHVEFVDIAGLVKGAHKGEGLGNQFLAHIREVAAIAHVVRCFPDPNVVHVMGRVDPLEDVEVVETELLLADLATWERRLERLRKEARANRELAPLLEEAEGLHAHLTEGRPARTFPLSEEGRRLLKETPLLTAKPVIYVANVSEEDLPDGAGNPHVAALRARAEQEGAEVVVVSAKLEAELAELSEEEARELLAAYGLKESGLKRLARAGYRALGLLTFFTAGEKEVRAWTVRRGTKAKEAAGEIHSDMERGFIRAEVIPWDRLVEAGGWARAKERGWVRLEGKDYEVQDGDVLYILFSV